MFTKLSDRSRNEKGFTLVELLVVIVIIGILAAIALPGSLGQRAKGQDASAKSDARNAVSEMESCYATTQTYVGCRLAGSGLTVGTAPGGVRARQRSTTGYVITAKSKSGNDFIITRSATGAAHTCTNTEPKGGCSTSTTW